MEWNYPAPPSCQPAFVTRHPHTRAARKRSENSGVSRPKLETDAATSLRMAGIRQRDTRPEMQVRAALRALGMHYRVRNRDLPGSPDVANRRKQWAIFVHGCFWHRHAGCKMATSPKRNAEFWSDKFVANVARDARAEAGLKAMGFDVVVVWECEAELPTSLLARIISSRLGPQR